MARKNGLWFAFKGMDSSVFGVRVLSMPNLSLPDERGTVAEIAGRSGTLWMADGAYDDIVLKVRIEVPATPRIDEYGIDAVEAVAGWLHGAGELVFGNDPTHCYDARITKKADLKWGRYLCGWYQAEVTFTAHPFKRLIDEDSVVLTDGGSFAGQGSVTAEPIIIVSGTADEVNLIVNGRTVFIDGLDGSIVIDCDAKLAYKVVDGELVNCCGQVTLMSEGEDGEDGWPRLRHAGEDANLVSWTASDDGSVDSVEIQPLWRWR